MNANYGFKASACSTKELTCTVKQHDGLSSGSTILSSEIHGGKEPQVLESARLYADLSSLKLSNARIIAGTNRMGDKFNRFDAATAPFTIASELFLLFRLSPSDYLLAGFLTWRIFQGRISFRDNVLSADFHGDGKIVGEKERVALEDIVLIRASHWQDALSSYASELAARNNASPKPAFWHGWGSWDYYADKFKESDLLENHNALKASGIPCNLLQIDDGYSAWGDWLSVKSDAFPDGIGHTSGLLAKEGVATGLWMAPFVAHRASRLFAEHPDWFLRDGNGKPPTVMIDYYILDYSKDEVCKWFGDILKEIKKSWGIKYFKFDFLAGGVAPCRGFREGMTPLERFHRCFKTIKGVLGDDVYVLGCSAVFGPCIGYVDAMRTGPDISPRAEHAKSSAVCNLGSYFLHGKAFNCDPDYLVVRSKEDEDSQHCGKSEKRGSLSLNEAKLWSDFVSSFGNAVIASDKIPSLREERRKLIKRAFEMAPCEEFIPLDLWAGGVSEIPSCLLTRKGLKTGLTLFNWEDSPKQLGIAGFEGAEKLVSEDDASGHANQGGVIRFTLPPRSSTRLRYEGSRPFDVLRKALAPDEPEKPIEFPCLLGEDFKTTGNFVTLPLGPEAKCSLSFDRLAALGMLKGRCGQLAGKSKLLGIPFQLSKESKVLEIFKSDAPHRVIIPVGRKVKSLYILHNCEYPVKGQLNSYLMKFNGGFVHEEKILLGTHIGNSSAFYSSPWNSKTARIAWHDPQSDACLYLMEWKSPRPEEVLEEIEVTWPLQNGTLYIVGIVGVE